MLQPIKQKFRKMFRLRGQRKRRFAKNGTQIAFGQYGIKATAQGQITSRQIEAARRVIARTVKRGGQTWIRIFPHIPITGKSGEVPMGSGKGAVQHYVANVEPGRILFELAGVTPEVAREALGLAIHKLPITARVVEKGVIY